MPSAASTSNPSWAPGFTEHPHSMLFFTDSTWGVPGTRHAKITHPD